MILLTLTLAGILTTQPVDHVYLAGNYFAYAVAGKEYDCTNAHVSLTGTQATVTAAGCTLGIFRAGFE